MANGNGNGLKSVMTFLAMAGIFAAIVTPMYQEMERIKQGQVEQGQRIDQRLERIEERVAEKTHTLDEKIQAEIVAVAESSRLESDRTKARFTKLESWQRWWQQTMPEKIATITEYIRLSERGERGQLCPKCQTPKHRKPY